MTSATKKDKDVIVDFADVMKEYNPRTNISKPFMTIYEKTSILSLRMEQLAHGAPSYLDPMLVREIKDVRKIAIEELKAKAIPFMVCRTLPTGKKEYWKLEDLIVL